LGKLPIPVFLHPAEEREEIWSEEKLKAESIINRAF
jgi:hypothetical protein